MSVNKLFSEFSIKKIWDMLLKHDKAMNSTILVVPSNKWVEQTDGTYKNTVSYASFKESDKLTVDLYDDENLSDTQLSEYENYLQEVNIINGALEVITNTKPTQTMTLIVKGDFKANEINISDMLRKLEEIESNFTMAANAIGDALVAKELVVPEGSSLLDMADIISNTDLLSPKITIYYQVDQGDHYSEKISKGEPILYPTSFTPTKDGWIFVGWRKDTVASSEVLSNEIASSSITLFAVFKKAITISFNGNGNTSGSTTAVTGYIHYNSGNITNSSITLPSPGFAKTNYRFTKWALSGVNGTQYSIGSKVTHSGDATYYALWEIQKQTGTVECTRGYSVTVTFPTAFSATPTVTFTEDINYADVYIASVSKSGVTFGTTKQDGTSFNWKGNIYWTATI